MRMIPDRPYMTKSNAELLVFEALRKVSLSPHTVGLHSLNLIRHEYKRFGEVDFVVFGPEGLFVIEVKGGRISRDRRGIWHYIDRFGRDTESREGPFRQAESGLHALMGLLESEFGKSKTNHLAGGYAVIVPQCRFDTAGAEWNPSIVADEYGMNRFGDWLHGMIRYWREKNRSVVRDAPVEVVKEIRSYLRPCFEAVVPLHLQSARIEETVCHLTNDQMAMVDVAAANPRVVCRGGAGTGKTFLAMELARRWTAAGDRTMFACKSPWLQRYLETRLQMPNLVLAAIDRAPIEARRAGVDRFDKLIVDEGQDLMNIDDLDVLDRLLSGGFENGQWCFFHDINNQSGLFGPIDRAAWDYLTAGAPTLVPLRINCRNTVNILEKVKAVTSADMGVRGAGQGPEVNFRRYRNDDEASEALVSELRFLVDDQRVPLGDITILSPRKFTDSRVAMLDKKILSRITVLDEYSLREFPPEKISFATIKEFKGLENLYIILIDIEDIETSPTGLATLYVGMSRAKAYLCLVSREELEP